MTADEPNVPAQLGAAHVGTKAYVGVEQRRIRRNAMSTALSNGVSNDELYATFDKLYGMTEIAVNNLRAETLAIWDDEAADQVRYAKPAAKKRLRKHIIKASSDGSWTAVANLEKVLMDIEGTADVQEAAQSGESRLTEAVLSLLGQTDEKDMRILIERERMYIEINGHDAATKSTIPTFDVEGVAELPA